MTDERIALTRILPPGPVAGLVDRALVDEIRAETRARTLLILAAGAGYGKTSLLSALARRQPCAAWLTVSDADRDPDLFLTYLALTMARALGQKPPKLTPSAGVGSGSRYNTAAVRLVNWLAELLPDAGARPLLLVLDDYHKVDNAPAASAVMQFLLEHLPPGLHVVMGTRTLPSLSPLPRWRASGRAAVINAERLRFDRGEAAALVTATCGQAPDPSTLDRLLAVTEGWPLGLQLLAQVWRRRPDRLPALPARGASQAWAAPAGGGLSAHGWPLGWGPSGDDPPGGLLFEYFSAEVLALQDDQVRRFLVEASVLDTMTPESCNHVLQRSDAGQMLIDLERQGLFLVRMGDGAWRFHHLFRRFLLREVAADGRRYLALQQAAAAFYSVSGHPEEAVPYWLAAGQYDQAAVDVGRAARRLLQAGRVTTLTYWLDQFPADVWEQHPALQYWRGHALEVQGLWQQALAWYDRAEAGYQKDGNTAGLAEIHQRRAYIATWYERRPRKVQEHALAVARLAGAGAGESGDAGRVDPKHLLAMAMASMVPGQMDRARDLCRRSVAAYRGSGNLAAAAKALVNPGSWIEFIHGDFRAALARLEEAAGLAGSDAEVALSAETLAALACNLLFLYRIEESRAAAQRSLALAEQLGSLVLQAMNHRTLAMAWQVDPGADLNCARHHVNQALALGEETQDLHVLVTAAYVQLRLEHRLGDLRATLRALERCMAQVGRYGDHWLAAHALANMGLVLAATAPAQAAGLLERALGIAEPLGDQYGEALARFGLALVYRDDPEKLAAHLPGARLGARRYGRGLLLGDFSADVHLLVSAARRAGHPVDGLPALAGAPGATGVEVHTLGGFAVAVDGAAVPEAAWRGHGNGTCSSCSLRTTRA